MIRLIKYIILALLISVPAMVGAQNGQQPVVINLMFLADRMDVTQLKSFATQYDAKINPVFYTSAYLMMIRVRQGAEASPIDVVSTQLHNQGALKSFHGLEPLNHELLPNLRQIDPEFLKVCNQDPGNKYTVPILGGVMCLLVNKALLNPDEITSYADLWRADLKGRVLIPEDMGSLMLLSLKVMNCEAHNPDKALVNEAWEKMCALAENSELVTNNAADFLLEDSEIALALVCGTDALQAMEHNPNLVMVTPAEGYLGWIEALSIPVNAAHKELAHAYINYIMQPQVLANICRATGMVPLSSKAYEIVRQQGTQMSMLSPQELLESTSRMCKVPLDEQYQVRWHSFVEDKQFLY